MPRYNVPCSCCRAPTSMKMKSASDDKGPHFCADCDPHFGWIVSDTCTHTFPCKCDHWGRVSRCPENGRKHSWGNDKFVEAGK